MLRRLRDPRLSALAAFLVLVTACHKYVPVQTEAPVARTTYVRAHLAEPRDFRLTNVSPNNVDLIEGEWIEWRGDSLALSAFWMDTGRLDFKAEGETVLIDRENLGLLEVKKIDPLKTSVMVAALVVLGSALGWFVGSELIGEENEDDIGDPQ